MAAVAACAKTAPPPAALSAVPQRPPISQAVPLATSGDRIANALEFLGQGRAIDARAQLAPLVESAQPDRVAADLIRQIDTDPRTLLGERSFPYTIRAGETLSMIAARYLGDANRFWALARYNGIAEPRTAEVGVVIRVPGEAPPPPPRRVITPPTAPVVAARPPERPKVVTPAADPVAANRLRREGLAQMARGSIAQAVQMLERALTLDPGNVTIGSDLARARRVLGAVRPR